MDDALKKVKDAQLMAKRLRNMGLATCSEAADLLEALSELSKLEREPASDKLESMTRMLYEACSDLALINEALGLDPDDGGAEPILEAIAELKEKAAHPIAPLAQEVVAWMRNNRNDCVTAESKRRMAATEIGSWKEIANSYSIPLVIAHPIAPVAAKPEQSDEDAFCIFKADPLAWTDPELSKERAVFLAGRASMSATQPVAAQEVVSENLKTWPERIWLQHGDDHDPLPAFAGDVDGQYTWCSDKIASSDVEYVRADLAHPCASGKDAWISVEDRLPKERENVLVCHRTDTDGVPDLSVTVGRLDNNGWKVAATFYSIAGAREGRPFEMRETHAEVAFWMELPDSDAALAKNGGGK
jgi:hypothetical protein